MTRELSCTARIAFRLPKSLYDMLAAWAKQEDRPLANLVYTLVKQAAAEHERELHAVDANKETHS